MKTKAMRYAEQMFDTVMDELGDFFDKGGLEAMIDEAMGPAKGPMAWMFKKMIKSLKQP